ncbi:MAG: hypothetical protein WA786_06735 [Acidimicrobiales bacterium]
MRFLTIVRHAKASPPLPMGLDFDRVLSGRGRRQCKELRAWAKDPEALGAYGPVSALVSSAARTRETYERSFAGTGWIAAHEFRKSLYYGSREVTGEDLLDELIEFDPGTTSLAIIGHNPSMHELAVLLAREVPSSLRSRGYELGGAYVFELDEGQPLARHRYELVARFIPD